MLTGPVSTDSAKLLPTGMMSPPLQLDGHLQSQDPPVDVSSQGSHGVHHQARGAANTGPELNHYQLQLIHPENRTKEYRSKTDETSLMVPLHPATVSYSSSATGPVMFSNEKDGENHHRDHELSHSQGHHRIGGVFLPHVFPCTTSQSIRWKVMPHSPANSAVPLITAASAASSLVTAATKIAPHQQSLAQHQGQVQPLQSRDDDHGDHPKKAGQHSPYLLFHVKQCDNDTRPNQQHQVLDHTHGQGLFSPPDRSRQHFTVTYVHHHVHSHPELLLPPLQEHLLVEELPQLCFQQPTVLLPLHGLPATHHNKAKASERITRCPPHSPVVAEVMAQTSEAISKVKPVSHLRHDTAAYLPEVLAKEVEDIAIVPVPLLQDYIHQRRKPTQPLCVQRHWWQSAATTAQLLNQKYFEYAQEVHLHLLRRGKQEAVKQTLHPLSCEKVSPVNKTTSDTGQEMFSSYLGTSILNQPWPSKHRVQDVHQSPHPHLAQDALHQVKPSLSESGATFMVQVHRQQEAEVPHHLPKLGATLLIEEHQQHEGGHYCQHQLDTDHLHHLQLQGVHGSDSGDLVPVHLLHSHHAVSIQLGDENRPSQQHQVLEHTLLGHHPHGKDQEQCLHTHVQPHRTLEVDTNVHNSLLDLPDPDHQQHVTHSHLHLQLMSVVLHHPLVTLTRHGAGHDHQVPYNDLFPPQPQDCAAHQQGYKLVGEDNNKPHGLGTPLGCHPPVHTVSHEIQDIVWATQHHLAETCLEQPFQVQQDPNPDILLLQLGWTTEPPGAKPQFNGFSKTAHHHDMPHRHPRPGQHLADRKAGQPPLHHADDHLHHQQLQGVVGDQYQQLYVIPMEDEYRHKQESWLVTEITLTKDVYDLKTEMDTIMGSSRSYLMITTHIESITTIDIMHAMAFTIQRVVFFILSFTGIMVSTFTEEKPGGSHKDYRSQSKITSLMFTLHLLLKLSVVDSSHPFIDVWVSPPAAPHIRGGLQHQLLVGVILHQLNVLPGRSVPGSAVRPNNRHSQVDLHQPCDTHLKQRAATPDVHQVVHGLHDWRVSILYAWVRHYDMPHHRQGLEHLNGYLQVKVFTIRDKPDTAYLLPRHTFHLMTNLRKTSAATLSSMVHGPRWCMLSTPHTPNTTGRKSADMFIENQLSEKGRPFHTSRATDEISTIEVFSSSNFHQIAGLVICQTINGLQPLTKPGKLAFVKIQLCLAFLSLGSHGTLVFDMKVSITTSTSHLRLMLVMLVPLTIYMKWLLKRLSKSESNIGWDDAQSIEQKDPLVTLLSDMTTQGSISRPRSFKPEDTDPLSKWFTDIGRLYGYNHHLFTDPFNRSRQPSHQSSKCHNLSTRNNVLLVLPLLDCVHYPLHPLEDGYTRNVLLLQVQIVPRPVHPIHALHHGHVQGPPHSEHHQHAPLHRSTAHGICELLLQPCLTTLDQVHHNNRERKVVLEQVDGPIHPHPIHYLPHFLPVHGLVHNPQHSDDNSCPHHLPDKLHLQEHHLHVGMVQTGLRVVDLHQSEHEQQYHLLSIMLTSLSVQLGDEQEHQGPPLHHNVWLETLLVGYQRGYLSLPPLVHLQHQRIPFSGPSPDAILTVLVMSSEMTTTDTNIAPFNWDPSLRFTVPTSTRRLVTIRYSMLMLACHLWTWAAMATVFTVSSTSSMVITLLCTSTSSYYYWSLRVQLDPGKGKSDFQSETKHGHKFNSLRTRSTTSPPSATCLGQMTPSPSTRWAPSSPSS